MPPSRKPDETQAQLKALAESLPFRIVHLKEFDQAGYTPERVRQPRQYIAVDSSMQAVGRFLIERGTVELLKPEQTMALFKEIHYCGHQIQTLSRRRFKRPEDLCNALVEARQLVSQMESAEEELFIANRRLIVNCVKPFFWIGPVWIADFLQEGSKALSNAIRKFDFSRGTPFFSYAQTAIQNRLRNFFRDHVRAGSFSVRPSREMMLVKGIIEAWQRDFKEEPSDKTIAKIADLPEERIAKMRSFLAQWKHMPAPPVSLDSFINEDGSSMLDVIEDSSVELASDAAESSEVWRAVEQLSERSRYIVKLRFLEGRTLEETGQLLNLTRARIKQIQDAALKKIRHILGDYPR